MAFLEIPFDDLPEGWTASSLHQQYSQIVGFSGISVKAGLGLVRVQFTELETIPTETIEAIDGASDSYTAPEPPDPLAPDVPDVGEWRKLLRGTATRTSPQNIKTTSFTEASGFTATISVPRDMTVKALLSYHWSYDTTSVNFECCLELNDEVIDWFELEPKDSSGSNAYGTGNDQAPAYSFAFPLDLTEGEHEFKLRFRGEHGGFTASLWSASLFLEEFNAN